MLRTVWLYVRITVQIVFIEEPLLWYRYTVVTLVWLTESPDTEGPPLRERWRVETEKIHTQITALRHRLDAQTRDAIDWLAQPPEADEENNEK